MFARALFAFLVLPGMAAFAVPLILAGFDPWSSAGSLLGIPVVALGAFTLLWCVRDFYVSGKGTLAPWSPPKNIVVVGFYRYSRNPMYVGVLILILGWALTFGSPLVALWGFLLAAAFYVRVVLCEEPWLLNQFPEKWNAYREAVPRWVPRSGAKKRRPESAP